MSGIAALKPSDGAHLPIACSSAIASFLFYCQCCCCSWSVWMLIARLTRVHTCPSLVLLQLLPSCFLLPMLLLLLVSMDAYSTSDQGAHLPIACSSAIASFLFYCQCCCCSWSVWMLIARLTRVHTCPSLVLLQLLPSCFLLPMLLLLLVSMDAYSTSDQGAHLPIACSSAIASFLFYCQCCCCSWSVWMLIARLTRVHTCPSLVLLQLLPSCFTAYAAAAPGQYGCL